MNRDNVSYLHTGAALSALLEDVNLVIFDFDGVVADSELVSLSTLHAALKDFGIEMSAETLRGLFLGRSLETIVSYMQEHGTGDHETFGQAWETRLFDGFRAGLRPIPLIDKLLDNLTANQMRYCVASSGTFERIGVALTAMGLTERFGQIYSAQQVAQGKPAPDLFLYAAEQIGVPPANCLVIEDSPFGVAAAKAANMRCLGFVGGSHLSDISAAHASLLKAEGADLILNGFQELVEHTAP